MASGTWGALSKCSLLLLLLLLLNPSPHPVFCPPRLCPCQPFSVEHHLLSVYPRSASLLQPGVAPWPLPLGSCSPLCSHGRL